MTTLTKPELDNIPTSVRDNASADGNAHIDDNISEKTASLSCQRPAFLSLTVASTISLVRSNPVPFIFAIIVIIFMRIEYTIRMVPFDSPPLDIGFIFTRSLHRFLSTRLVLNTVLAALNTVFVATQTVYILWTLLVEGRPRPTTAAVLMFTCRGLLGCATQIPLPKEFLPSKMDFPVSNISFFLFFSGHVAGAIIASLDMRRMKRYRMSLAFNTLNTLQGLRLLSTRGHYTIDLVVGVGAGILADYAADILYQRRTEHVCCNC